MGVVLEQIAKAEKRARELDIGALVRNTKGKSPIDLADSAQKSQRLEFLRQSLGDTERAAVQYERIIRGNELQDVNYLARGEVAARAIARISIRSLSGEQLGWGTGFLIAPGVLLTNHHVLPTKQLAVRSEAQFDVERDIYGRPKGFSIFEFLPDTLYYSNQELDFAVIAVREKATNTGHALADYGYLPLVGRIGKVVEGEWLTIIQHPNGELKQLCARENKLLKRADMVLWYSTDTLGGSSGSPVFNNDWYVVALHHSGVPDRRDGVIQTINGTAFDPTADPDGIGIKWVANEGIRTSKIVEQLAAIQREFPQLRSVLASAPESARIPDIHSPPQIGSAFSTSNSQQTSLTDRSNGVNIPTTHENRVIQVTLRIDENGQVSIAGQERESVELVVANEAAKKGTKSPSFDVPFDNDYSTRKGFQANFLGSGHEVNLPELSPALVRAAAPRIDGVPHKQLVLDYHNYSLVMHAERRFAIYTAANVRCDRRYVMGRPSDVWRTDPRIAIEHQVTDFYYKRNQFDRGHLTRREDLEFGATALEALASAADTCHWTNCTPQHARFNQNKELWQGIERYILEGAVITGRYNTQVFTGPILEEDDPVYEAFPDIQYPVRFWKVVATLNSNAKLFATAYILDQSEVIAAHGIESTVEAPFGAYKTFQVRIEEVERLTGLAFSFGRGTKKKPLSTVDPMLIAKPRTRRMRDLRTEEIAKSTIPDGYLLLERPTDIWLGN